MVLLVKRRQESRREQTSKKKEKEGKKVKAVMQVQGESGELTYEIVKDDKNDKEKQGFSF